MPLISNDVVLCLWHWLWISRWGNETGGKTCENKGGCIVNVRELVTVPYTGARKVSAADEVSVAGGTDCTSDNSCSSFSSSLDSSCTSLIYTFSVDWDDALIELVPLMAGAT